MTSRTVPSAGSTAGAGSTPVAGPGDRPHLPPVQAAGTSRRTSRKAPLAWLPWLLLGLLALTLLAAALLAKVAGDERSATGGALSSQAGQDGASSGSAGSGSGPGDSAALSAGGQDLLAVEGGRIGAFEGETAEGAARVESVVADEGFWVGQDASNRVFVYLTPEARRSAGESGFQVKAGQTVSLAGTVKASSPEFATSAGVTDDEGARQLAEQGAYVEATEIRLAQ